MYLLGYEFQHGSLFYNWNENRWTEGPPMNHNCADHACAVVDDGKVFVFGGFCENFDARNAEVFDGDRWTELEDIPVEFRIATSVTFGGDSVIVTGIDRVTGFNWNVK